VYLPKWRSNEGLCTATRTQVQRDAAAVHALQCNLACSLQQLTSEVPPPAGNILVRPRAEKEGASNLCLLQHCWRQRASVKCAVYKNIVRCTFHGMMCCGAAGWLARLLRGGRSIAPQIVLLDHGTYIHLDEQLRQQYCQLWCSFVMNDTETARQVSLQEGATWSAGTTVVYKCVAGVLLECVRLNQCGLGTCRCLMQLAGSVWQRCCRCYCVRVRLGRCPRSSASASAGKQVAAGCRGREFGCALCMQMSTVLAAGCNRMSYPRWHCMCHAVKSSWLSGSRFEQPG
jgi:ABC1 atypical kinase-like domain